MVYWLQCKVWTEGRRVLRQRQNLGGFCNNLGTWWQGLNLGYGSEKRKRMPPNQLEFVCVHIYRQGMQKRWDMTADLETKMRLYPLPSLWNRRQDHCSWSQACTKNIFVDRNQIHWVWGWLWPLCKLSQQVWKWKKRMKKEWNNSNTTRTIIIREGWLKFREWKMKGHKISAMLGIFTVRVTSLDIVPLIKCAYLTGKYVPLKKQNLRINTSKNIKLILFTR